MHRALFVHINLIPIPCTVCISFSSAKITAKPCRVQARKMQPTNAKGKAGQDKHARALQCASFCRSVVHRATNTSLLHYAWYTADIRHHISLCHICSYLRSTRGPRLATDTTSNGCRGVSRPKPAAAAQIWLLQ